MLTCPRDGGIQLGQIATEPRGRQARIRADIKRG
jgi:hypothetical protein